MLHSYYWEAIYTLMIRAEAVAEKVILTRKISSHEHVKSEYDKSGLYDITVTAPKQNGKGRLSAISLTASGAWEIKIQSRIRYD